MRRLGLGLLWWAPTLLLGGCGASASDSSSQSSPLSQTPAAASPDSAGALGHNLRISVGVVANQPTLADGSSACPAASPGGLCAEESLTIENHGPTWNTKGWAIYYSSIRRVVSTDNPEFTVTHLNGDLTKIEPSAAFTGFAAGESKRINAYVEYWMISNTDVMPRFYIVSADGSSALVDNTNTEDLPAFVAPLTTPAQQLRFSGDVSVIATAATRFAGSADVGDRGAAAVANEVVPSPAKVTAGAGTLDLGRGVTLYASGLRPAALAGLTARLRDAGVPVVAAGGVPLTVSVGHGAVAAAEGYRLHIDGHGVTIVGSDGPGAYYGVQTLIALLPATGARRVPQETIDDSPRYLYRGVQIDVARNFHGADEIVKVLDQMAAYKLNTLHLHLSDDEGWRLEIPGLPELVSVGSRRCGDLSEQTCLMPQLGAGPFGGNSGSGHLSRADFIRILQAATARYIDVVPEFDMPGHVRAAIKSMQVRAAHGDSSYLLSDPNDTSQYVTAQYYDDDAINACRESTYAFVGKVMDEVHAMYAEAGATLATWHLGGDEVGPGAWTASPICQQLYQSGGPVKSAADVHAYFIRRVNALAQARGFAVRGWSDGLLKNQPDGTQVFQDPSSDLGGNSVSINYWGTLFWWDNRAYQAANIGYKVILTNPDFLYLDHPYEADPDERGYYWATRFTDVRKLFSFISGDLPANSQLTVDRMGNDYTNVFQGSPNPVQALTQPQNVVGLEGALWGETVRSDDFLEYMVFPRLLALAERAWHRGDWEPADGTDYAASIDKAALQADWERFANVLGHKELPKLDRAGIRYRIEVPGARIVGGILQADISAPGLTIEYQTAGGVWKTYDAAHPPKLSSTQVRARTSDGRIGRAVPVAP